MIERRAICRSCGRPGDHRYRHQASPEPASQSSLLRIAALTMFCLYLFVAVMVAAPIVAYGLVAL